MKNFLMMTYFFVTFATISNVQALTCRGHSGNDPCTVTANFHPGVSLTNVSYNCGPFGTAQFALAPLRPYTPRSPLFAGMNRFQIGADGWSTESFLLPQSVTAGRMFYGFFYSAGESAGPTIRLTCQE